MELSRSQCHACFIDFTYLLQWLFAAQSRDGWTEEVGIFLMVVAIAAARVIAYTEGVCFTASAGKPLRYREMMSDGEAT
jgi:hypothetical protein